MPRYLLTWAAMRRADARKASARMTKDIGLLAALAALAVFIGTHPF